MGEVAPEMGGICKPWNFVGKKEANGKSVKKLNILLNTTLQPNDCTQLFRI